MALPEDMEESISSLEESLSKLEEELEPLLNAPWEQLTSKLEAAEKAKLNLMIAYAADSLFYMFLKTQGASTEDHPVTEELARIKKYMGNLKALGQGAAEEQARLKVNKEAAQRFISGALGGATAGGEGSKRDSPGSKDDSGRKKKKKKSS